MTPLSYQSFGFTAILMMVGILSAAHLLKYLKERFFHRQEDKNAERLTRKATVNRQLSAVIDKRPGS